jgi:hypothetical protein
MWEIPVHMARNAEGLNQQVGVGGIIGWPGATIPLLTAFTTDVILVSTASWPGNLLRGTKLRQQEVQPCPGLR